ncbi:MAG: hypothetical protein MOB07_17500 [Acidobacteria bacterium]|nr:hypothetical protein [Acidobacteriota bacterium]
MKNNSPDRPLAAQSSSLRLYADNYDEITMICRENGRKHAEEIRDLIDEALRARRREIDSGYSDLIKNYEQLVDRNTREKQALSQNMREFYGLLLETLSASLGSRRLAWNYVAHTVLKQSKYTDEQIKERYEAEAKAWTVERDAIADALEQAINNVSPTK